MIADGFAGRALLLTPEFQQPRWRTELFGLCAGLRPPVNQGFHSIALMADLPTE